MPNQGTMGEGQDPAIQHTNGSQHMYTTRTGDGSGGTRSRLVRGDLRVVIAAVIGGFGGGILAVTYRLPPVVIAVLFSTGATSLVYGFLGGIQGASFTMGTLKLTGTMAVLVGLSAYLNGELIRQLPPVPITTADFLGDWKWNYARGAWDGHLTFTEGGSGQLIFSGEEYHYKDEKSPELLYRFSNGTATLAKSGRELDLQFDVEDLQFKRIFQLKTTQPLVLVPAFRGDLRATGPNVNSNDPWGIMIYKRPPGAL